MFGLRKRNNQADSQSLPLALRAEDGTLLCTFPTSVVANFRQMITELIYTESLPAQVAIVAALRGEGVTYTSLALGMTIASDLSRSVCVVDLNWWFPGLLNHLGQGDQPVNAKRSRRTAQALPAVPAMFAEQLGIADILSGQVDLDAALIKTALPNMALLSAGSLPIERRPVIARSVELRKLITELSQRYDHLILDIPAILNTSDAIALASLSNSCCLVVHQGITSKTSVKQALDAIKHLKIMGMVLNHVTIKTPRWLRVLIPQE